MPAHANMASMANTIHCRDSVIGSLGMPHQLHQKDTYITPIRSTFNSQGGFILRHEAIKMIGLIDFSCTFNGFFRNRSS